MARQWLAAQPQVRFLPIAAGLYAPWILGYEHDLEPTGRLDDTFSRNLAVAVAGSTTGAALRQYTRGITAGLT